MSSADPIPSPAGAGRPPARSVLLLIGVVVLCAAIAIGAGTAQSMKQLIVFLGGFGALIGAGGIIVFAPRRLNEALFFGYLAVLTISIDVYWGFVEHVGGWPGIRVSVSDLALIALAPSLLVGLAAGRLSSPLPRAFLGIYAMWISWYFVSASASPDLRLSAYEIASALHSLVVAFVVAAFFRREHLGWILGLLSFQVVVHGAFAIVQFITKRPIGATWFGAPETDVILEVLQSGERRLRPSGLFDHPIVFANFLLLMIPLLIGSVFWVRHIALRLALLGAAGVALAGLVLTLSRGAWLSTVFALGMFLLIGVATKLVSGKVLRNALVAGVIGTLGVAIVFGPRIYERFTQSDPGNLNVRFELNAIAWRMALSNPITGIGLNTWVEQMAIYDPKDIEEEFPGTVHNVYLLELSEAGFPGLFLFLLVWGFILVWPLKRLRRIPDRALAFLVLGLA